MCPCHYAERKHHIMFHHVFFLLQQSKSMQIRKIEATNISITVFDVTRETNDMTFGVGNEE